MKFRVASRLQRLVTAALLLGLTGIMGAVMTPSAHAASSFASASMNASAPQSYPNAGAHAAAPQLQKLVQQAADVAQRAALASAAQVRLVLSAVALAILAFAALAVYLQIMRARHERAAREAREQLRTILQTVQEGCFWLDVNLRIGAAWSAALARMFGREDFTGLAFEELLQGILPAATIATAAREIKLLWDESAQENSLQSIDPLGELEIRVDDGRGGRDTRRLQFSFHRVVGASGVKQVLVSVADVTASALLARELLEAQHNADSQVDTLLGALHVDPLQLAAFLDATEAGLQLVNAVLKESARSDGEFRIKLDRLLREMHAIKADASALGIAGVAQRTHKIEDLLSELKERSELSGVDFLPLVLKLDELLAHLRSVRELTVRIAELQTGQERALPADDLAATLQGLAARLGQDQQKKFRLSLHGLAQIPPEYHTTVRDLLIQLLRNSAVHGIEPAEARRAHGKPEAGLVHAEFRANAEGYELVFEDDGAGLAIEKLKTAAIRKHLTTAAEAARMDTRAAMGLIFRAGVSTCERVTLDAGRGVGMEMVARRIAALGGKIVLSTDRHRFTRVKIALPALQAATSAVA